VQNNSLEADIPKKLSKCKDFAIMTMPINQ
jgi:hypothetical protein